MSTSGSGTGTPSTAAALGSNALVTLADQKAYLGETGSSYDTILVSLIDAVSELFNKYTGRNLTKRTYTTEYLDGSGDPDLLLPWYPVITLTSVYEDDALLVEGRDNDFVLYSAEGMLRRMSGVWLESPKAVKITLTAGYIAIPVSPEVATLPLDLKLAAQMQVAAEWKKWQKKDWGESSRTFPDGSITKFQDAPLLPEVKAILDRYVRRG